METSKLFDMRRAPFMRDDRWEQAFPIDWLYNYLVRRADAAASALRRRGGLRHLWRSLEQLRLRTVRIAQFVQVKDHLVFRMLVRIVP